MLLLLARHGESVLNFERRVNGDPGVVVPLTEQGREEARRLGAQVANVELDLCVHTRFPRTRETAELALAGRDVPSVVEPQLDDVRIGDLEGLPIERYREVKRELGRKRPFPGGESLDDAALRYAAGFRALLARPERRVLVVCHEIPVRYALNAAAGSDELDGPPFHDLPNAVPFLFDGELLRRAADRIEQLAS
ncbi:MAG TPA: histidine phosphatase family protein [Gaiellaceae bacterium]|nr:histidine phosphatase family protein [Gaiellaceae bacterium]